LVPNSVAEVNSMQKIKKMNRGCLHSFNISIFVMPKETLSDFGNFSLKIIAPYVIVGIRIIPI